MTPADLERFRKIAGLLGSEHEGERSVAALKASAFLKEHGLTWADVTVARVVGEADDVEMRRRREEVVREADWAKDVVRRRNRARWAQTAEQADADGFYADLRDDIRRRTRGEDGTTDPRVRK